MSKYIPILCVFLLCIWSSHSFSQSESTQNDRSKTKQFQKKDIIIGLSYELLNFSNDNGNSTNLNFEGKYLILNNFAVGAEVYSNSLSLINDPLYTIGVAPEITYLFNDIKKVFTPYASASFGMGKNTYKDLAVTTNNGSGGIVGGDLTYRNRRLAFAIGTLVKSKKLGGNIELGYDLNKFSKPTFSYEGPHDGIFSEYSLNNLVLRIGVSFFL